MLISHPPQVGAYAKLLQPPMSRKDITYWLNYEAQVQLLWALQTPE